MLRTIRASRSLVCGSRSRQLHRSVVSAANATPDQPLDLDKELSEPTWSVSSLLPSESSLHEAPRVTSKRLHHLLRLSALPPPQDQGEEDQMLRTLSSQLHFVEAIRRVDTTGVQPLASLRDETAAGRKEAEIGLDALKDALAQEEIVGRFHKRIRRKRSSSTANRFEKWDVLGSAEKTVGRFFVVESGKD